MIYSFTVETKTAFDFKLLYSRDHKLPGWMETASWLFLDKLNTNASVRDPYNWAAIGGVLRDTEGKLKWVGFFC